MFVFYGLALFQWASVNPVVIFFSLRNSELGVR